jgi:hypothetical protein
VVRAGGTEAVMGGVSAEAFVATLALVGVVITVEVEA